MAILGALIMLIIGIYQSEMRTLQQFWSVKRVWSFWLG